MSHTSLRYFARITLMFFVANSLAPTFQFAFADSTQYYVDATTGSDTNDGLTPATAWQTVAQVNSTQLLQGDTVSFLCGDTWNEGLAINSATGSTGLPITINGYGPSCATTKPTLDAISVVDSTEVIIDGINIDTPYPGNSIDIGSTTNLILTNSAISSTSGLCLNMGTSTSFLLDSNVFTNCQYGIYINNSQGNITNNIFSTISQDAIAISSSLPVTVSQNNFRNIAQNGIIYGQDTTVTQNSLTNICSTSSASCAAIKNNPSLSGSTITSTISQNTIKDVGTGITGDRNYGISIENIDGTTLSANNIINAEKAIQLTDASNISIANNTLFNSRSESLRVVQNNTGSTFNNTFDGNTLLQKNPDYSYINIRDEFPGVGLANGLLTMNGNTIFPNYKPNVSYIRTVKFGGETMEYSKNQLDQIDPTISKFEYFAYKPYANTGSFATANLLSNPGFDIDGTLWSASADIGASPVLSHNVVGSYSGGSLTITPPGGAPDRMWVTNDTLLNITSGQTYLVTGYLQSGSGDINIRAFLHQSGNQANIYSDRIAETYASSTGRTFSFYLTTTATAVDANISFESSSQDISYEIDSISVRRMNAVVKNINANETLIFSNTGASAMNQLCPGGVPCASYVDGTNTNIGAWSSAPISIPAYSTYIALWNNSPNILNTPTCSIILSPGGSVPTGQPLTVDWTTANSLSQVLSYTTYTGAISTGVASTGSATFIPPYDAITTISLNMTNDVGMNQCSSQVTTTNTAPSIFPGTITGSEDSPQIDATLSGVDYNPGDSVFFEGMSLPANGFLNIDISGSIQYFPNADYCGTESFDFRAYDQFNHYADPITQTIQVACTNDTPTAVNDAASTAGVTISIDVLANDTDPDSPYALQTFTFSGFTLANSGTVVQNGNNLDYTPNGGFSGTDIFQYRMVDQSGALSNTGTVTVTVTLPNNPPVANPASYTTNEDVIVIASLSGSDPDSNTLTFTPITLPTNGTMSLLPNGNLTYTPNANYFGTDSFDFIVNDGTVSSASATVSLTINSVLDAPVAANDNYSPNQDTTFFIPVTNNDSDVDSTVLTLTGYTNPSHGVITVSGTGFNYTPTALYSGPDSFTYRLIDDTGVISNAATVTLNVVSTNSPPIANTGSFSTNEDTQLVGVLSGTDPEMSTLTYITNTLPSQGTLSLSSTGVFVYTPNANYYGADAFTFHVFDGSYNSSVVMVDLTVASVNDIPAATPGSYTVTSNIMTDSGYSLTANLSGTDVESMSLNFSTAVLPTHGVLTLSSTGNFQYIPAIGYVGTDSFTFRVSDGSALSNPSTVSINIVASGSSGGGSSGGGSAPVYQMVGGGGGGGGADGIAAATQVREQNNYKVVTIVDTGAVVNVEAVRNEIFFSAPSEPAPTVFVLFDPTGLLGQLFLLNKYMGTQPVMQPLGNLVENQGGVTIENQQNAIENTPEETATPSILDSLDSLMLDDEDAPSTLRRIAQLFIREAESSSDPSSLYDMGIEKVISLETEEGSRMAYTQEYVIRIFDQHKRRYEETITRNTVARPEDILGTSDDILGTIDTDKELIDSLFQNTPLPEGAKVIGSGIIDNLGGKIETGEGIYIFYPNKLATSVGVRIIESKIDGGVNIEIEFSRDIGDQDIRIKLPRIKQDDGYGGYYYD